MVYSIVALTALVGLCSLAVDLGRAQVAKIQLQRAADGIARYAAQGLPTSTAGTNALVAAADNTVDGSPLTVLASDVTTGTWDSVASTFTAGTFNPNAVRVNAYRTQSRGTAIPLLFAKIIGQSSIDIHATSIAIYSGGSSTTVVAPSSGDPWLAGMPNGTTANTYDAAPANSPALVNGVTITPGATLNFSFTGHASYYPGTQPFDPDGNTGWIIYNYAGREHGMSQLNAPLTAVVGVFLDNTQPDQNGNPPPDLDFSSDASRDFATLAPQLRQPFFIGNGLREDGITMQNFVVPAGATRLFLGIMDGQQWSDNSGSLTSSVVKPTLITMVK
jgi:hypothetical protein